MMLGKRILAAIALVLGTAMLLISLAGAIGVWIVKGPVTERATHVFERIEAALNLAGQTLDHVDTSLARAAERLEGAREEESKLAKEPQRANAMRRTLARTVQRTIVPEVGNAQAKLHSVAEAAVAVNSVLEDVGSLPFLSTAGLDTDRLAEMNSRLADVGPAAWELSRLLGEPGPESDEAGGQLSRVGQAVQTLRTSVADYKSQMTQVQQRTEALKSRTLQWITPVAVLISLICFWIALSQVSVLCHAWSWWKQPGPQNSISR
jgi:hypothetical protein